MYASAEQVAMQDRRTARSPRFLLRLGILFAAFAAAFVLGTVAAQADEQNATSDDSAAATQLPEPGPADDDAAEAPADDAAEAPTDDDPIIEDEGKYPPDQQDQASLTEVTGAVAIVPEVVADTAEIVEEVPAAAPVADAAATVLREAVSTTDEVVGEVEQSGTQTVENTVDAISHGTPPEGLPEDLEDTAHSAVAPLLDLVPDGTIPGHETPGHDPSDGTLPGGVPTLPNPVPGIERGLRDLPLASSPASSTTLAGSLVGSNGATPAQLAAAAAAPAASTSSDLGGDSPLTQLLGGDHGVVTGGSGAGAADRATPAPASYGDHTELVSDPVRTDARPHTAPVARPEFAPD
jgi:hypothetical protein